MGTSVPRKKRAVKAAENAINTSACSDTTASAEELQVSYLWDNYSAAWSGSLVGESTGYDPTYTHLEQTNSQTLNDGKKNTNLLTGQGNLLPFKQQQLVNINSVVAAAGSGSTCGNYYLISGSTSLQDTSSLTDPYGAVYVGGQGAGPQAGYIQCLHGVAGTASFVIPPNITGTLYGALTSSVRVNWAGTLTNEDTLNVYCGTAFATTTGTFAGTDDRSFWQHKTLAGGANFTTGETTVGTASLGLGGIRLTLTSSGITGTIPICGVTVTYQMVEEEA